MTTIYRYFLILMACAALLLGIQAPNFVDQYEKRLDAHLLEVETNLKAYQDIADQFFGGSIAALIDKHEHSADEVFRAEAKPIRIIFDRWQGFKNEQRSLDAGLTGKLIHIAYRGDRELVRETLAAYTFTVPLNGSAIACGFTLMIVVVLIIELFRLALRKLSGMSRRVHQNEFRVSS
jgi:hypothetical protein